jgi:hypothetical protein
VKEDRASTRLFWLALFDVSFLVVFAAALAGDVYLVVIGWWSSTLDLIAFAVLAFCAFGGVAFFADGLRRDYLETGFSIRRELSEVGRRIRGRQAGREQFAAQRFTGNARRRR